jgi:hypothetical protein
MNKGVVDLKVVAYRFVLNKGEQPVRACLDTFRIAVAMVTFNGLLRSGIVLYAAIRAYQGTQSTPHTFCLVYLDDTVIRVLCDSAGRAAGFTGRLPALRT